jgi:hypothetical protein
MHHRSKDISNSRRSYSPVCPQFTCLGALVTMFWPQKGVHNNVWEERHIFITGGSDGIGLALATVFLERKAKVTIASRSESKLASARNALKERAGSESLFSCSVDVGDWKEVINSFHCPDAYHTTICAPIRSLPNADELLTPSGAKGYCTGRGAAGPHRCCHRQCRNPV